MNTTISKIFVFCMILGVLGIGAAAAAPTVLIDPASTEELAPEDTFQINILVDPDGNGVSCGQVDLSFDASVLEVTNRVKGDMLGTDAFDTGSKYDNTAGTVTAVLARIGATTPPTPAGTWATITFQVKTGAADCMTDIDITFAGLDNEAFETITDITTTDGTATVGAAVQTTLTVFTVEPATVAQGETVDIDIAFSEEVDWVINVNNSTVATVESWSGTSTNPTVKYWDTTTETPTGDYTVDVFMNGALVGTETVTVEEASIEPTYGVTISQPDDQTTYEGVDATYLLTVTNTGDGTDTFDLEVTNVDGATTAALNMTSIALDAAASGVVALDVTNTAAGTFNATVSATSQADSDANATTGYIMTTVEVAPTELTYGVTISQPGDQTTYEDVNATYLLTVMNTGTVADTFDLEVTNVDGATTAALNMTSIALDAAASGVVALDVTNTAAGTFNVTVSATSQADSDANATTGYIMTTVEAPAADAPTVLIDPASTTGLEPGDTFQINISVDPAGNGVSCGQVDLSFDASVLEVTNRVKGDMLGTDALDTGSKYNNTDGTVIAVLARVGATTPPTPAGNWATITFQVKTGVTDCTTDIDITFAGLDNEAFATITDITTTDGTATIAPVMNDTEAPYTTGHDPAADATDVPIDTIITVHVLDDGTGVNESTIVMTVDGAVVTPDITGTAEDCTLVYDPAADFGYDQLVNVAIDASDLAGNEMHDAYSFTTTVDATTTIIAIDDAIASTGGNDAVTPVMINNVVNVGVAHIEIHYDPSVVGVVDVSDGDFDFITSSIDNAAGVVRIGAVQVISSGLNGDVLLAEVTLRAKGGSGDTSALSIDVKELKDVTPQCNPIQTGVEDGIFTVSCLCGDVNGDGNVLLDDAMYLAKHCVKVPGFEQINECASDVNCDGAIEMADAMYLAKHCVGVQGFEQLHCCAGQQ